MKDYSMRRKDRLADESVAKEFLAIGEYGVLSTVGEDGFPYGVPVNYAYDGESIYFHCAKNAGHKQDNLGFCNNVSFTVVCKSEVVQEIFTSKYKSVIVFGVAEKIEEKRYALELLVKKYSPEFVAEGSAEIDKAISVTDIYKITPCKISAKVNI